MNIKRLVVDAYLDILINDFSLVNIKILVVDGLSGHPHLLFFIRISRLCMCGHWDLCLICTCFKFMLFINRIH